MKKALRKTLLITLLPLFALLGGCGSNSVADGNFAIGQNMFTARYDRDTYGPGFNLGIISNIHEYFGREELIKINEIHPKDKDNILLRDLNLVVAFRANREKAVDYLIKTGDVIKGSDTHFHLGLGRVDRDARQVVGPTVRKFSSMELLDNPTKLEETYKKDLQAHLDHEYGAGTFAVVDVKVANILVADIIEQRIQSKATIDAEQARNEAIMKVLASRETTLSAEARVIKRSADAGGISVDQLLYGEMIKALRDGVKADVMVPAKPGASAPAPQPAAKHN